VKKWSLIVFTLLSQMAVGGFWVLIAVIKEQDLILVPLMIVEAIMVISMFVSLAHLGSPFIAYKAILNIRSSWLSREISTALLFTITSGIYILMLWGKIGSPNIQIVTAWIAAIFGFLLIYSMSRLYMLRTVPVWNTPFTPISFLLTALTLGGLVVGSIFIFTEYPLIYPNKVITALLLFYSGEFILLVVRIISYFFRFGKGKEIIQNLITEYRTIFYLRVIVGFISLACLVMMLSQTLYAPGFFALITLMIFLVEITDRFLFYTARELSIF